jgi:hypothetical protein
VASALSQNSLPQLLDPYFFENKLAFAASHLPVELKASKSVFQQI